MIYDRPPKPQFTIIDIPKLAFAVAALMVLIMFGLWSFSRPSGASARLKALEQQAALIAAAKSAKGDLNAYPLGSVCSGVLNDVAQNQLSRSLMASGLNLKTLDIRAEGKTGDAHPLMAYHLTLNATGSYEQAVTGMEIMAQYHPVLFLDRLSLRNQTSEVELNVEGRLYCRWKKQG